MRSPLWLGGLRSRPLVNLLLLALATVAVATAVLGPLLIRAVHQYTVASVVAAAPLAETTVALTLPARGADAKTLAAAYAAGDTDLTNLLEAAVAESGSRAWQPPETAVASVSNSSWTWAPETVAEVASRVNAVEPTCAAYALSTGRCPDRTGEVAVGAPDAQRTRLAVGDPLTLTRRDDGPQRLTVVGIYDPTAADRGQLVRPGTPEGGLAAVTAEPLLVSREQAAGLGIEATVTTRLALAPRLTVPEVADVRATLDAIGAGVLQQQQVVEVELPLPQLLDRVATQARTAAVLMAVTVVQAVGLALFGTAIVLQRVARTRAAEWGIGRLRGVPRRRWLSSVYAEPALVLLAGLPLGFALGTAVARVAVDRHLDPAIPLEPARGPVLAVAALATAGALAALVGVSRLSGRRPLPELISQAGEPRRLTVPAAVAQSALVLLAATTLYQLVSGTVLGRDRSLLGLLAPGLFALALAVLAVRVAVLVVRAVTRRPPRSLAALVVGRQTARTPSTLNPAVVLATGVALAVFAGQVQVLAERNADLRAAAVSGADQVLAVAVPPRVDLLEAVRRADPSGQWAMAAAERAGGYTGGTGRIVAVDSTRLAAVAAWSPEWAEVGDLAAALRPATAPPLALRGTRIDLTLADVRAATEGGINPGTGAVDPKAEVFPPDLQLTVDTGLQWKTVGFALTPTSGGVRLSAEIPCAAGCRLVSLGTASAPGSAYTASFTVTGIGTDRSPASASAEWLREPGRWREVVGRRTSLEVENTATAIPGRDGLDVVVDEPSGGRATLVAPADTDDPLPALVGPDVLLTPVPGGSELAVGTALDGQPQVLRVVGRAAVLPRSLRDGVLVDLQNAQRLVDPRVSGVADQVWLRDGAPPEVEAGLTAAGIRVQNRELRTDTSDRFRREAVPLAAMASIWVAGAVLLLSLLTLAAARVGDAGRRRRDWAALRQAGLGRRTLRRLAFAEIAVPALLGVGLGLGAGLAAIRLAAARLPLVDPLAPGPPLDLSLAGAPVAALGLGLVLVVAGVAAVGAALETRPGRDR